MKIRIIINNYYGLPWIFLIHSRMEQKKKRSVSYFSNFGSEKLRARQRCFIFPLYFGLWSVTDKSCKMQLSDKVLMNPNSFLKL